VSASISTLASASKSSKTILRRTTTSGKHNDVVILGQFELFY
jgi:hypothetical protein